jgi:hypothetical protein
MTQGWVVNGESPRWAAGGSVPPQLRSRADLINLAYFLSLWCLRKYGKINNNGLQRSRGRQMMLSKASDMCSLWFFLQRLCILTLKLHGFNSLQSSLRSFRDWGLKQLRRNAYMCVNFKLEYILTLRHNRSRADIINLAYFLSLWCLRKFGKINNNGSP